MSDKVIKFERRKINEWPREVYLADFDGTGEAKPYGFIQYPDDTTPLYVRYDIVEARIAEAVAKERERIRPYVEHLISVARRNTDDIKEWNDAIDNVEAAISQTEGEG